MKFLGIITTLTTFAAFASDTQPLMVVAQKSTDRGLEQVALVFEGDDARLLTNSNFLSIPMDRVKLGLFKSPQNEVLKTRLRELVSIKTRLDASSTKVHGGGGEYLSPHRIRYFVAGHELNEGAPFRDSAIEIIKSAWSLAEWQPADAVEAVKEPQGGVRLNYSGRMVRSEKASTKALRCEGEGTKLVRCVISPYGTAYFHEKAK